MQNAYLLVDTGLVLFVGGKPSTVDRSHVNFNKILEAVRADNWDRVNELANIVRTIATFGNGSLVADPEAGTVTYRGDDLHGTIVKRILDMIAQEFSIDPLVAFLDNLNQNPSKRAVDELYQFVDYGQMPITPDGCFLAYKRVNRDYTSVHDGKTLNAPADKMSPEQLASLPLNVGAVTTSIENGVTVLSMPRNKVDDQSDRTCSHGLHFCSHEYLQHFSGAKVVVLKVNPRDVVSIPTDYNNTKGRACRYEIVGELTDEEFEQAKEETLWKAPVVDTYEKPSGEEVSQSYFDGYRDGYADGRYSNPTYNPMGSDNTYEYNEGFNRGEKDGRGHKAKVKFTIV